MDLGPKSAIEAVNSTGSFLDGGRPLQRAAISLLEPDVSKAEIEAIQDCFRKKRDVMIAGLKRLGVSIEHDPKGTFYLWGDISSLPEPLNDGMAFFRRALDYQVITVPGVFFDVNPGRRRAGRPSRFRQYVRFSFGPELSTLEAGLKRLARMLNDAV